MIGSSHKGSEHRQMVEESDWGSWSSENLKRERLKSPIIDLNRHSKRGDVAHFRLADGKWLIFRSPAMVQVVWRVEKHAPWECDICILGERGTGKELFARLIHDLSGRTGPFKALNSAAMPPDLVESYLFGHVKGAFTGATESKVGYFEAAEGGTLFLDEIGDLSVTAQAKILRAMQERTITRVGSVTEIKINTRIIAATNQDLCAMAKVGAFRNDLVDRFKTKIVIPPLRKRPEDILILAGHFLKREAEKMNLKVVPAVSSEAEKRMLEYDWPGNARELENVVYMALVETLPSTSISGEIIELAIEAQSLQQALSVRAVGVEIEKVGDLKLRQALKAVQQCGGNQAKAARSLGITRQEVHYYVKKFLAGLDLQG
ncbi:MAG TPA: sigma-54 dependent transcriptional regulator [Blastocatellia bacterium]|jgi:DNA-binding NtrC family response regulator|nr:sigma-54 dependent transcriptional regulator [Blastocatellia bacterium]